MRKETANWDKRFMDLAKHISSWSKDRNTKTGAIICDANKRILSLGYNGLPSGAYDAEDSRYERPQKYMYTEHAERNAIYTAARNGVSLEGSTIYIMWFPCSDCARAIIQAGIKELVCYEPDFNTPKWGESFKVAKELLIECDVNIKYIEE